MDSPKERRSSREFTSARTESPHQSVCIIHRVGAPTPMSPPDQTREDPPQPEPDRPNAYGGTFEADGETRVPALKRRRRTAATDRIPGRAGRPGPGPAQGDCRVQARAGAGRLREPPRRVQVGYGGPVGSVAVQSRRHPSRLKVTGGKGEKGGGGAVRKGNRGERAESAGCGTEREPPSWAIRVGPGRAVGSMTTRRPLLHPPFPRLPPLQQGPGKAPPPPLRS